MAEVNFVVTCTQRKRMPVPDSLRLSSLSGGSVEERLEGWISLLTSSSHPGMRVLQMYAGEQWAVVRNLKDALSGGTRDIRVWVLSAGYGLIPEGAEILPYSATFSKHQRDSVCVAGSELTAKEAMLRWWKGLGKWEGPVSAPRSLTELAEAEPDTPIVLAASSTYLGAVGDDLQGCRERLSDPRELVLCSAGASRSGDSPAPALAFDRRLASALGGSMMSLNVRVAASILGSDVALRHDDAQRHLDALSLKLPKFKQSLRPGVSDQDVKRFIRKEMKSNRGARWSPLLKRFRRELGCACEQKRFRALFHEVSGDGGAQAPGPRTD